MKQLLHKVIAHRLKFYFALLAIYILFMLNCLHFHALYFTSPRANILAFVIVQTIPLILLISGLLLPKVWMQIVSSVVLMPLLLFSAFWLYLSLVPIFYVMKDGEAFLERKVRTVEMPYYNLTVYAHDWSAWVVQEKEIFPGLLLVRHVHQTGGWDLRIEVIDANTIKANRYPNPDSEMIEYKLKRFVYF